MINNLKLLLMAISTTLFICCKTDNPEERLIEAVIGGNIDEIEVIDKEIKNKNFLTPEGGGALHTAVEKSEPNIVQKLLLLN